jgi:hypothetical protein
MELSLVLVCRLTTRRPRPVTVSLYRNFRNQSSPLSSESSSDWPAQTRTSQHFHFAPNPTTHAHEDVEHFDLSAGRVSESKRATIVLLT